MDTTKIPDDTLRQSLSESLNIFQATMTLGSVFLGFVFAGLLQFLSATDPLTDEKQLVIRVLVVALLALLGALIGFHFVANQVLRYWNVFMPRSKLQTLSSILLLIGILAMLAVISLLLFAKNDTIFGWIVGGAALLLVPFIFLTGTFHGQGANTRTVD